MDSCLSSASASAAVSNFTLPRACSVQLGSSSSTAVLNSSNEETAGPSGVRINCPIRASPSSSTNAWWKVISSKAQCSARKPSFTADKTIDTCDEAGTTTWDRDVLLMRWSVRYGSELVLNSNSY